ncbi:Stk1 family PASTA domain-containing Ser/Thr kinase [Microbacterium gorillae]|uniref:Stk1 family PASTA domain-containing Ser/Thr kinase n=1 Tax=Microbacterium gorillae TaxID=1231063 RepID=UPI0006933CA4|nr:Stk1 family PASTA domain-containing Ser/Thr kinase [Microbacterium gorillae]
MTTSQTADPLIGRLVDGRYRVRARIARGGMATVYVATDLRLERRIALKVMHGHLSDDTVFQSRFIQEARAAARLADPNVVNVFDQGQDGELAYLVMEYLPGITLRELLKEQRRLTVGQTITIMDSILSGLAAAHRAGIVHRDVKPENVLLAEDGRIKIGDFGLARATTANTATGQQLMGTIAYLAPELVTRGTADARSDIYALGIMLYEMLVGEQPYRGEQPMQIAFQHATESVPRPSVRNPGVPEQLDELVLWSTEREPDDRPTDAKVMLDRLREIERQLGVAPVVAATREPLPTAGLAIPDEPLRTEGATMVLPATGAVPTGPVETGDNSTRLRKVVSRNRRRGGWLVVLVLVLAALAGGAGWWFGSGPGSQIAIPDLRGASSDSAVAQLRDLGLTGVPADKADLDVPAGKVVSTKPGSGSRVDAKSSVTVYVSTGPAAAKLATFVGVTEEQATSVLGDQHIDITKTSYVFTGDVAAGQIISVTITPRAGGDAVACTEGCSVHQGDKAALAVSRGDLPTVKGLPEAEARAKLTAAKLVVEATSGGVFDPTVNAGLVAYVNGPRDRDWQEGDSVTLVVSRGAVPDVAGKSESDARSTLDGVGLKVSGENQTEFSDTVDKGAVIGIADRESGNWFPGDTVTLIVSKGVDLVTVPTMGAMTISQAVDAIRAADLVPIVPPDIDRRLWSFVPAVNTDPQGGTSVRRGSEVTITGP